MLLVIQAFRRLHMWYLIARMERFAQRDRMRGICDADARIEELMGKEPEEAEPPNAEELEEARMTWKEAREEYEKAGYGGVIVPPNAIAFVTACGWSLEVLTSRTANLIRVLNTGLFFTALCVSLVHSTRRAKKDQPRTSSAISSLLLATIGLFYLAAIIPNFLVFHGTEEEWRWVAALGLAIGSMGFAVFTVQGMEQTPFKAKTGRVLDNAWRELKDLEKAQIAYQKAELTRKRRAALKEQYLLKIRALA